MLAFLGSALLWASLPPVDWGLLAWIAPIPWVLLIRREKLDGWRPYTMLGLAGFAFWMATLHFMRLPHWATSFGWIALSFYFAFYLPAFVGLSRVAVHRLRVPMILAAPIVWTGLELARAHLLTGMSLASLGHTQYRWIELIQLSDLAGAYGVGFVVMFVAASLASVFPCIENENAPASQCDGPFRRTFATICPLLLAVAMLAAALIYGHIRIEGNTSTNGPRIALIQGSSDVELFNAPDAETYQRMIEERCDAIFREYVQLSDDAVRKHRHIDLLVWPESMFPWGLLTFDPKVAKPANPEWAKYTDADFHKTLQHWAKKGPERMTWLAERLDVPLLLGANRSHLGVDRERSYTSAFHVGRDGKVQGRYDKIHLVMFGEYMPFVEYLPWLQYLTPLTGSATSGERFAAFDVGKRRIAPSICYESVLSHVIRGQVNQLAAEGREPDILINLTNNGWFWGSSELDLHLICGVFRAVECRKPLLVAANTGFSAWIDSDGRIQQQGPRRAKGFILAEPRLDVNRRSWYLRHGDWFAALCFVGCVLFGLVGLYGRTRGNGCGRD